MRVPHEFFDGTGISKKEKQAGKDL